MCCDSWRGGGGELDQNKMASKMCWPLPFYIPFTISALPNIQSADKKNICNILKKNMSHAIVRLFAENCALCGTFALWRDLTKVMSILN
jgi:hypothetical protein